MSDDAGLSQVIDAIDDGAVSDLALQLGQIDSPSGAEHAVSDFLFDWCAEAGLTPRRVRAVRELAANVVAGIPGTGGGKSLLFNSHMDTAVAPHDETYFRHPDEPAFHTAWREGDKLVGVGLVNDKGPMAAWLIAAAAIRRCGVHLAGDIVLTMVTGEIGHEPVDEFDGLRDHGKDFGSRYVATHGALADFAVVAETTGLWPVWTEAGKAFYRITVHGRDRGMYTPYLQQPYLAQEHPNAIVRAAALVPMIEEWASQYQVQHSHTSPGGEVVPKVNIGAIRAGHPTQPILSPTSCRLYLDVRIAPNDSPLQVREQLRELLTRSGMEVEVDCYLFRRGYEASGHEPLVEALSDATRTELPGGSMPAPPGHVPSSMWRDLNVWNELGIPAVTFGPGTGTGGGNASMSSADLARCARIYARTALRICA